MSDVPLHHWIARRRGFLERTLADLTLILDRSYAADAAGSGTGVLQRLDPRVKLASALVLILHAALTHRVSTVAAILIAATTLALVSRLPPAPILRLWLTVGLLAALLAIPAWWITGNISVAAKLVVRPLASSTIAAVLVLSTPWQHVLKAMRQFGVPVTAVVLIGMSYRYIVLFLQTAIEMTNARRSRTMGRLRIADRRRLAMSGVGVLLEKALGLAQEVHLAMQARGYRGEVFVLDEFAIARRDWLALTGLLAFELILLRA